MIFFPLSTQDAKRVVNYKYADFMNKYILVKKYCKNHQIDSFARANIIKANDPLCFNYGALFKVMLRRVSTIMNTEKAF